jgi:hypothetical protein
MINSSRFDFVCLLYRAWVLPSTLLDVLHGGCDCALACFLALRGQPIRYFFVSLFVVLIGESAQIFMYTPP